ncbi:hypothetical protein OSTOST_06553, partial [Ostertagia ostertagi]
GIEDERRRRGSAFDRCSERVRLAKEKGVYRAPSLDATVQKKPGESDESTATSQKQPKRAAHVQWSTQNPSVAQVDETTTTPRPLEWATGKPIQSESVDESRGSRGQSPSRASQQRRRSDTSRKERASLGASPQPSTSQTSAQAPIALSDMPSTSKAVRSERRSSRGDRRESSSPSPNRLTSERTSRRTRYSEPNAELSNKETKSKAAIAEIQKLRGRRSKCPYLHYLARIRQGERPSAVMIEVCPGQIDVPIQRSLQEDRIHTSKKSQSLQYSFDQQSTGMKGCAQEGGKDREMGTLHVR